MGCNCGNRAKAKFRWTDGENVVIYESEIAAKAKVQRKGGTYTRVEA